MPAAKHTIRALAICWCVCGSLLHAQETTSSIAPPPQPATSATDQLLADTLATIVREAIPRDYARDKDWGHTKRITTGVTTDEPLYKFKLHRRKKHVPHGTWKRYRVQLVDPDEQLKVTVANLHSLEGGGVGLRLILTADLDGWAQMRHYNRGVHLLTLTAEGTSQLRLVIDCQVRMKMTDQGMAVDPQVTAAKLDLQDFDLQRLGEIEGKLAHELGKGMRGLLEDQLEGPALMAKLNRAIDKKRDRLVVGFSRWPLDGFSASN